MFDKNGMIVEDFDKEPNTFRNSCSGIRLVKRGDNDNHIIVEFYSEDDGYIKFVRGMSTAWISDTKRLLSKIEKYLKTQTPDMGTEDWNKDIQYGYKFNVLSDVD